MLFVALIVYIPLVSLAWLVGLVALHDARDVAVVVGGLGGACLALTWLVTRVLGMYGDEGRAGLRNLMDLSGVKVLSLAAVVAIIGFALWHVAQGRQPPPVIIALLVPALVVCTLNAAGLDLIPRVQSAEPGRVVVPDFPRPAPVAEDIVKTFRWRFEERDHQTTVVIRRAVYDELKQRARLRDCMEWANEYVLKGISGEIRALAQYFYTTNPGYGSLCEVTFVFSFVRQVITYQRDEREYPRYPIETLVDGVGDCEDFSILGAALLKAMGYEVALMFLPSHAALGVAGAQGLPGTFKTHNGVNYYYCEMTADGWKIGEIPHECDAAALVVSPVPALPVKIITPEQGQAVA